MGIIKILLKITVVSPQKLIFLMMKVEVKPTNLHTVFLHLSLGVRKQHDIRVL